MRQTITGLVAALAVVTASAAPALACGGVVAGGCSPCGPVVSPCAGGYAPFEYGYSYGYGAAAFQRLPDPTRYYYVNQGPTYTGPGQFAPRPYYDDRAVSVYRTGSAYTGGVYADAFTHQYVGAPALGPVVYRYHGRHFHHVGMHHGRMHRMHDGMPHHGYRHHMMHHPY